MFSENCPRAYLGLCSRLPDRLMILASCSYSLQAISVVCFHCKCEERLNIAAKFMTTSRNSESVAVIALVKVLCLSLLSRSRSVTGFSVNVNCYIIYGLI